MTHAGVLVRAERSVLPDLGGRLAGLDGVAVHRRPGRAIDAINAD